MMLIFGRPINTVEASVFSEHSELYQRRSIISLFSLSLQTQQGILSLSNKQAFAEKKFHISNLTYLLIERTKSKVILCNSRAERWRFRHLQINRAIILFQIRKLNYELMVLATRQPNLFYRHASLFASKGIAEASIQSIYTRRYHILARFRRFARAQHSTGNWSHPR